MFLKWMLAYDMFGVEFSVVTKSEADEVKQNEYNKRHKKFYYNKFEYLIFLS